MSKKTSRDAQPRQANPPSPERPEDERLPLGKLATFGLQHVLTMYGGLIAVPLIVGGAAGLSADRTAVLVTASLFIGGLATVLQSVGLPFLGSKLPLVQGVSFASVATMVAILAGPGNDLSTVAGSIVAASILGFVVAPFFARIIRFFPPVVTGVVITAIGLTLVPVAADWAMGGDSESDDYGSLANIGLAFLTLVIILLLSKVGSATLSRLSILLGLVGGTLVGALLGLTDFSEVGSGSPVAAPEFLAFGVPEFDIASIISMTIVILVIKTETAADIIAVGEIIGTSVDRRRIANGLRADMLSSAAAPLFGSFTQSAFAQNVGLVALTGVKSRFVVASSGVIMIVLGLLPIFGQVISAIPMPVLGGAGVVLFGTVTGSGIRNLRSVSYDGNMNLIIVSTSLAFAMIPVVKEDFYHHFPEWFQTIFHSGISSAAIMAVLLNLLFNELTAGNSRNPSVFAAKPVRVLSPSDLRDLREGDVFVDGRFVDCDGEEVPLVPDDKLEEVRAKIECGEITDTSQIPEVVAPDGDDPSDAGPDGGGTGRTDETGAAQEPPRPRREPQVHGTAERQD
ncbi:MULTISPECIES: nucleobase:cation symporter-2 family protein [Prauserella salsuginis group]|uniref:Nucleobase:cation symporter-2 family protein n=1 Tax=Prauserella salsuginis TaxID=387889 RepID=A0ABW6G3T2_9PSEU|nr:MULTISPECIES: nucleobase:cation symporter-2 family protein [Prauserella salsuginis group]MCR3718722.1 nucleobase:cation symporter-2, NCS2 family [Prauserella flava]MCR3733292.1 nucleobase:cation symporter-2, NCS2 family [Prauserella salsuginis]